MTLSLYIGGILSIALAIFHAIFYNYFHWEADLKNMSVLNGKIFMTIHIGLIAMFVFFGLISFIYAAELSQCNGIYGFIVGFYSIVWIVRTILQVTYLKHFKTERPVLNYILIVWFLMLLASYSIPVASKIL